MLVYKSIDAFNEDQPEVKASKGLSSLAYKRASGFCRARLVCMKDIRPLHAFLKLFRGDEVPLPSS